MAQKKGFKRLEPNDPLVNELAPGVALYLTCR
jgi:hypothetical protein